MAYIKFDADTKKRYVEHLREGALPHEAARIVGITTKTVVRHRNADKDFAEDEADAREAASEAVEKVLHNAALAGEPWAVTMWLGAHNRQSYGKQAERIEISGHVVHELDTSSKLEAILALKGELAERYEVVEVVELERGPDIDEGAEDRDPQHT